MPTINGKLTHSYLPKTGVPVGFEATFEVYDSIVALPSDTDDPDATIEESVDNNDPGTLTPIRSFKTTIEVDSSTAVCWSLFRDVATGKRDVVGNWIRDPADEYDSSGITAEWTEAVSVDKNNPTRYILKVKFGSAGANIQVSAKTVQVGDASNVASDSEAVPILVQQMS